jgi:hypothetical protein
LHDCAALSVDRRPFTGHQRAFRQRQRHSTPFSNTASAPLSVTSAGSSKLGA